MSSPFRIEGGTPLRGTARVPGDKSISHRALLIAALSESRSRIRNLSNGEDLKATRRLIEAIGAVVREDADGLIVEPGIPHGGQARSIDCGNSGTTMRLGAGALTRAARTSLLWGDPSLTARPMGRVLDPLCSMGANAWSIDGHAPIIVQGGELHGIDFRPPIASAQVKGAVLFAALGAAGETTVREPVATRAHTEEMLRAAGADIEITEGCVRLRPSSPEAIDVDIPGDPSAAAFWVVAALIVAESDVRIEGVYRGPGRDGFLDVLGRMGADISITETGPNLMDIQVRSAELRGTDVTDPVEIAAAVDELPAIAVAAAFATGTTVIRGAQEMRLKESDRLSAMTDALREFGVGIEGTTDGLVIQGRGPGGVHGAKVESRQDHRIAMAMAVAASAARGTSAIEGWGCVRISDPGFESQLASLRAA